MNLEEALREALQGDAAEVVPVGPGPEDARRRAFRRRRRMHAGVVAVSALALAGASLAVVESRSSGPGPRVQAQPSSSQTTPELAWRAVDGTVLYQSAHFTTSDGITYALSTAPGATGNDLSQMAQYLYATHDGVNWSHTSLGEHPWVADLAGNDGVLYAVGTGPGSVGNAVDYSLSTSSDGGANWTPTAIPVSFTPPAASVRLIPSTSVRVAHRDHTTVVIASADYSPDFSSMHDGKVYIASADGVQVIDPATCKLAHDASGARCDETPTTTKSWSDFGISDPGALHQVVALVRPDGGSWSDPVSIPTKAGTWDEDVSATTNGFLLSEMTSPSPSPSPGSGTVQLLSSTDGRTWTPLGGVPAVDTVSMSGDRVIGVDSRTSAVYTSNDGGATWSEGTDVADLAGGAGTVAPYASVVDVGPLGYAVVVQKQTPRTDPPSAKTGGTLAPDASATHSYLLYSADGNAWKITDLDSVGAPAGASVANTSVGADHIDVTFQDPIAGSGNGPTTSKLTTLVGTPRA